MLLSDLSLLYIADPRPPEAGQRRGALFITIEEETGVANGILRADRFEAQRRTVMTAHMVTLSGRVQREGEVIHVIIDTLTDEGARLARILHEEDFGRWLQAPIDEAPLLACCFPSQLISIVHP